MVPTTVCNEAPATTPPDFEKDAQEFFSYFEKTQNKLDDDMIWRLKEGLDALLVYAGLFASVNATFLIYTLPDLSPDPADVTNELLSQLIQLTISPNQSTAIQLPTATFTPDSKDVLVNRLFSLSLSLSLLTAFFIVCGKQWLGNYRARNGAGVERWDQLNRDRGAKRWKLVTTLEWLLPLTLISSLVIFAIGLGTFVGGVDYQAGWYSTFPLWLGYVLVTLAGGARLFDPWCPYYTPLNAIFTPWWRGCIIVGVVIVGFVTLSTVAVLHIWNLFYVWIQGVPHRAWAFITRRMTRGRCWASGQTIQEDQRSGASASSVGADLEGSHQASLRLPRGTSTNDASDYTTSNSDRVPVSATIKYNLAFMGYVCRAAVTKSVPFIWRDLEAFHGDAIVQILNFSRDRVATYHTAASICTIGSTHNLNVILRDKLSREHLTFRFRDAVRALSRSHKEGRGEKTIGELQKRVAVFGTALFHLYFSVGSWALVHGPTEAPLGDHPSATPRIARNRFEEYKVLHLKNDLEWLCHVLDYRPGGQPTFFTSMRLAAGLLWASIDPGASVFEEASRLVAFQSEEITSAHIMLWSQLALLVLACNRRGRGANDRSIREQFLEIQNAYNTKQPTNEFSDAVYQAIRGHSGEKTRLPSDVFKLAWKMFVQGRQGEHAARALGSRVPFLGILESKVRDDEKPEAYREFFQCRRSECFEVVLDTVRSIPYSERKETSAPWRSQAKFVFKAVNHYAMCIIEQGDTLHAENHVSLGLIRSIKALVPPIDPARADPAQAQGASETEYRSEVKTFEETCKRFESFIRSGQIKRRLAPEEQWCFSRTSLAFRDEV